MTCCGLLVQPCINSLLVLCCCIIGIKVCSLRLFGPALFPLHVSLVLPLSSHLFGCFTWCCVIGWVLSFNVAIVFTGCYCEQHCILHFHMEVRISPQLSTVALYFAILSWVCRFTPGCQLCHSCEMLWIVLCLFAVGSD